MSSQPGVNETLELLEKLGSAIHHLAGKEQKLNSEFLAKSSAETKRFEDGQSQLSARLSEELSGANATFQDRAQRCQTKFERRQQRIIQARKLEKKHALDKIEEQEGRRKYKLQEGAIEAERRKETSLAAAAASLAEFQARAAETRDTIDNLEETAKNEFRGYRKLVNLLARDKTWPEPDLRPDEHQLLEELLRLQAGTSDELIRFRTRLLPRVFKHLRIWLLVVLLLLGLAGSVPILHQFGVKSVSYQQSGLVVAGLVVIILGLYQLGQYRAGAAAKVIAGNLAKARRLLESCLEKARLRYAQELDRIKTEYENRIRFLDEQWKQAVSEAAEARDRIPKEIDERAGRVSLKNDQIQRANLEKLDRERAQTVAGLQQASQAQAIQISGTRAELMTRLAADERAEWSALESEWKNRLIPIYESIRAAGDAAAELFPEWHLARWEKWAPPKEFKNAAKFGRLEVDAWGLAGVDPKNHRLTLPCPASFSVPLLLSYPRAGSILFETSKTGGEEAMAAINNILFRLLSTTPPGKLSFTILDPVGLGQSFAGIMHLADYEESLINSRIWTQSGQIEEKLAELSDHMEKVIQMYLRNEYATIAEYNARAGVIAEKYHFLVIAGFPVNFTDSAIRRLLNISSSGARCGVHTLIQWDLRHPLPQGFIPDDLRKNSIRISRSEKGFELAEWRKPGTRLTLDAPPPPEFVTEFLHKVGRSGKDSNRVEVPFEQVAPPDSEIWTGDTSQELRVPIGRSGATKLQYLAIGKGTRQHGLIAGKTGSGKSTLFHVIITNLALWCGPDQVEFYLVDFKKGVEFKCYATHQLPHARVVAIESDRQFGLSVLQTLDAELRRRGDLFRQAGAQDLAGYKRAGGTQPVPRALLLIDEFQEFFVEEDRISQGAAVLLDRIVRQGRAFGIHVLLGSQTLGGAYTLARATIGQMVIRIALQCNEADALLIMDQDNPAPRLLSRPGEGIYNDAAGAIEGNSPFQAVWISDETRDLYLEKVRTRALQSSIQFPAPFVFEGNVPADVRANSVLTPLLESRPVASSADARVWLGAPNSIKGPTEVRFQRQSGNNLLIVGQNEDAAFAILSVALVSLAAQYPVGGARFILLDTAPPGSAQRDYLDRIVRAIPHEIIQTRDSGINRVMSGLAEDLKKAESDESGSGAPRTYVFIHNLQNHNKLRQEDEFSYSGGAAESAVKPSAVLLDLITNGPSRGFHVIASCDSYNNINRFLGRKNLSEFEMRVLFQMSAGDSASLIDTPDAGALGLHKALFYNDREGYLETFRPYALPGNEWIEEAASHLAKRS